MLRATVWGLTLLLAQVWHAQAQIPRLTPSSEAYAFAVLDEPLGWEDLLSMAQWASSTADAVQGMDPSLAPDAIRASVSDFTASVSGNPDPRYRGEAALSFIHTRFLRYYSANQTRVDAIISSGRYNCVSSAVLYAILARAVDLDVGAVATSDHAFCSVAVGPGERVDVETTNRYGFDPGTKKEFHDSFGKATGFAYVPQRDYSGRKSITLRELVSLILQNRIVDLESAGNYAAAVGLAADRWALLGSGDGVPKDDFLSRALNYGASLGKAGREAEALAWAAEMRAFFGPSPRLDELSVAASNNLVVKLVGAGKTDQAAALITRYAPLLPSSTVDALRVLVADGALTSLVERGDFAASLGALQNPAYTTALSPERLKEIGIFVYLKEAERHARGGDYLGASGIARSAELSYGEDKRLVSALGVFRANRIAQLHNSFASLYNAGRYPEALAAAKSAADEFPGEERFSVDLAAAERAVKARFP